MCFPVYMSFDLFYMCLSISSFPSFESKPIGCSSTVVAMPLAKPATKKTINAMNAMKAMKVAMKAMKGMKAPKSIGKPMKPKKEKTTFCTTWPLSAPIQHARVGFGFDAQTSWFVANSATNHGAKVMPSMAAT